MRRWFRGKPGGLIAFLVIAGLIAGGLGWVTAAVLRLEHEQHEARADAELQAKFRQALWQLDSVMVAKLAQETNRPFSHYNALSLSNSSRTIDGKQCEPGTLMDVSPLVKDPPPDWVMLHFSTSIDAGWWSPQVLTPSLLKNLVAVEKSIVPDPEKRVLLNEMKKLPPETLMAAVKCEEMRQTAIRVQLEEDIKEANSKNTNTAWNAGNYVQQQQQSAINSFADRAGRLVYADQIGQRRTGQVQNPITQAFKSPQLGKVTPNNEHLTRPPSLREKSREEIVSPGVWTPLWMKTGGQERLMLARRVTIGEQQVCQGILLNWQTLQEDLTAEVKDFFPEAKFVPVRLEPRGAGEKHVPLYPPRPERTLAVLPIELDPGPLAALEDQGWTPLRIGLALAWAAALVALAAVGLGGWSLIDLSQRRIRFVSTVTHELRTPLTTLRLYLDMLTGGMVQDEKQKEEYLHTLNAETDRLNRLVGNVLDFSRLENHQPRLELTPVCVSALLEQVRATWTNRCKDADKELLVDNTLPDDAKVTTDVKLVQQVLGNLIDNACKYSQAAEDKRILLRARTEGRRIYLEVEDRGPGVARRETRSIFRPFHRGKDVDAVAGGVGLGLALSQRWAALLGGQLTVHTGGEGRGACFRLTL